jgi:short-subunit dehydrogenase
MDFKGQTALITGASSGIGEVFAKEFARRKANVVLVARSADKLEALARSLAKEHGVRAEVIPADLTREGSVAVVAKAVSERGLSIDVLVNNAGFATYGTFETVAIERQRDEVVLNVTSLVEMTHAFLPAMVSRGRGAIINVASTAAFQPVAYMATYGATKAFVLSFSEALWAENRRRGVNVLALCPGATQTAFFDVVGSDDASLGPRASPEDVVESAFSALAAGRSYVIPGARNYLLANLGRLVSRRRLAALTEQVMRPKTPRSLPAAAR